MAQEEEEEENNRDNLSFASTPPPSSPSTRKASAEAHKNNLPSLSRPPHVIKTEYIISSPLDFPSTAMHHMLFSMSQCYWHWPFFFFFLSFFLSLSSVQLSSCAFFIYLLLQFSHFVISWSAFSVFQVQLAVNEISPWKVKSKKKQRLCKKKNATAIIKENVHFLKP